MPPRHTLLACAALAGLAACTAPPAPDPFEASGELVALSGGAAGAGAACVTCHGMEGEGDGLLAPRLAGLDPGYIARQLEHFDSGARRHPQMEWIAHQLDMDARQKVAAYYARLPVPAGPAGRPKRVDCGAATIYHEGIPARSIPSCASCHGADGAGSASAPPLASQPAPYLAHQLDAWASGERYGDADGVMRRISRSLAHRDRQAVADYAARLPGVAGGRPIPETCPQVRRRDRSDGA